jgi:hypothetical protein
MMRDAVSMANWKRMERGLAPLPEPKVKREEPIPPVVEGQLRFDDLPAGEIRDVSRKLRHPSIKNSEGVNFVGYDVFVDVEKKDFSGWMNELDCERLEKRIPAERSDLRVKFSL